MKEVYLNPGEWVEYEPGMVFVLPVTTTVKQVTLRIRGYEEEQQ